MARGSQERLRDALESLEGVMEELTDAIQSFEVGDAVGPGLTGIGAPGGVGAAAGLPIPARAGGLGGLARFGGAIAALGGAIQVGRGISAGANEGFTAFQRGTSRQAALQTGFDTTAEQVLNAIPVVGGALAEAAGVAPRNRVRGGATANLNARLNQFESVAGTGAITPDIRRFLARIEVGRAARFEESQRANQAAINEVINTSKTINQLANIQDYKTTG